MCSPVLHTAGDRSPLQSTTHPFPGMTPYFWSYTSLCPITLFLWDPHLKIPQKIYACMFALSLVFAIVHMLNHCCSRHVSSGLLCCLYGLCPQYREVCGCFVLRCTEGSWDIGCFLQGIWIKASHNGIFLIFLCLASEIINSFHL